MAEELKVVLKRSEDSSFGFSLLGTAGLPHVIYDIMENSPAAECGVVSQYAHSFKHPTKKRPQSYTPSTIFFSNSASYILNINHVQKPKKEKKQI